ncbi:hypothetical protein MGN70_001207 [Eutypa lata]|nr:hypothetical protein MGN70_001207 [Eutypa lata]
MSYYYGPQKQQQQQPAPPPLPPRSPRPPGATDPPTYGESHWTYPPPPPGPPPRGPGVLGDAPPPIPPRPPGFKIRNMANSRLSPAHQAFLPPPLSPNRQAYPNTLPPPPPRSFPGNMSGLDTRNPTTYLPSLVQSSPGTTPYGYTVMPPSDPVITSTPPIISNVPQLPPSQPLQSPGASVQGQFQGSYRTDISTPNASPYVQYTPAENNTPIAEAQRIPTPVYTQASSSPHSTSQIYSQAEDTPPPVYTPVQTQMGDQHVNMPPYPPYVPGSNQSSSSGAPLSPGQAAIPSLDKRPSTHVDDIEGTMQSLNINQPPSVPPPPSQPTRQYTSSGLGTPDHTPDSAPHPSIPPSAPPKVHIEHNQEPPQAVQACIDSAVTFTTDWYWHPQAPEFWICSKCYTDHIRRTQFRDTFTHGRPTDGNPRLCRFSKLRMRDCLFKAAISSGHLHPALLDWMRFRPTIPNCRGTDGVKAEAGIEWYKARGTDIPHFVCCRACYEDVVLASPGLSACFERAPPQPQDPKAIWSCDMAIPYVAKEYEGRGKLNDGRGDWIGFATEAKARMSLQPCPGIKPASTWRRPWFVPTVPGLEGRVVACAACYCDRVAHTGEEPRWRQAAELSKETGRRVRCDLGAFNVRILMGRCHDTQDFAPWWRGVAALQTEQFCDEKGIPPDSVSWYTLKRTNPPGFQVCHACYLCVVEPMNLAPFFERKQLDPTGKENVLCCFNITHPRIGRGFLPRLLEAYFTRDTTALGAYATEYASIAPCPREDDAAGKRWFGWRDCTICPECWHEFGRHHAPLADKVELRGDVVEGKTMCEMYSPRMRKLYLECNSNGDGEVAPLLQYSAHRRMVWCQTVLPIRQILFQSRLALSQQKMLNTVSSHYYMKGGLQELFTPSAYSYSQAGLGTFANHDYLQGAQYAAQASGIVANATSGSNTFMVGQLEQKWRAVE